MTRASRIALGTLLLTAACGLERPTEPSANLQTVHSSFNPTPSSISLTSIGSYAGGGIGAAEVTAFDPGSKRLFVINGALGTVDVLDLTDPASPTLVSSLSVTQFGSGANSVATDHGVVAIAIQAHTKTDPGTVAFYDASTLQVISNVTVGALPDMVIFSRNGDWVVVANEGEPNDDYTVDPEGSISIINVTNVHQPTVRTAGFGSFNARANNLRREGVRIFGPGATVAQDMEPEYVAISDDNRTAWVTLQENNALAIVDIRTATVTSIRPLGYKNHGLAGNGIDASDKDGPAVNIRSWPVFGMYMPDAIAAYSVNGQTYLVTANEGDARDYPGAPGFAEEARIKSLPLNTAIFTDAICGGPCSNDARLGRLTVTTTLGMNPNTGVYDALYAFGARSFSIWNATGQQVWDSGDQLEQLTTSLSQANFNASNSANSLDDRSDNKGPEPEGVVLAQLGAKTYAFIGLERVGGVMVYDVTNPMSPFFVAYASNRAGSGGDRGPEGLAFVPANRSPNKKPLLIVGNEVSGTTRIYEIVLH